MDNFTTLLDRLEGVRQRGTDQAEAKCPAHMDNKASLSIARGSGGRVIVNCHAGCSYRDVLAALDLPLSDLFGEPRVVAEYVYTDADSKPLYVVERWEPKSFKQRMIDGRRRAPRPEERVLYNLPAIEAVKRSDVRSVFFVEGEKDADTLATKGYAATTSLGGANKPWLPQYTEALAGLRVVIVADNDEPGRKWARAVANQLHASSSSVVLTPPKGIKDVSELLEAGYEIGDLQPLPDTMGETFTAADYPVKQVEWLWAGRIPAHMLTLLEGDPGTGKSTMTMELVACLTTGRPLPGQQAGQSPMTVGLLSDEDNWSMVVVPRLQAAGADLRRVVHFRGIRSSDGYLVPYSLTDLNTLRHDIRKIGVGVLVIDPLMAYLGTELDTHRDQHVRSVLGPLVQMAEEDGVTILAVRHFTKGSLGGKAIYRGGGSIGFTGQARAILQTGEYPQRGDEQEAPKGRYVLAVAKCNLAPLAPSLGYRITTDDRLNVSRVAWDELPVPVTAAELGQRDRDSDKPQGRDGEALVWLQGYVEEHWSGHPFYWPTIMEAAKAEGVTKSALEKMRPRVLMLRIVGPGGRRAARWVPISEPDVPISQGPGNGEMGKWQRSEVDDLSHRIDPQGYDDAPEEAPAAPHTEAISPFPHSPALTEMGQGQPEMAGEVETAAEAAAHDPSRCSICGGTDGLIANEDGEARCRWHNWMVWSRPEEEE